MKASDQYLQTLLRYYEEEIAGEAYFYGLRNYFQEDEKLTLLAQVERHAAASVEPLLEKYGLTPKSEAELKTEGESHVQHHANYTWNELIAYMSERYPAYLDDFANLKAMAPEEDYPYLDKLTDHEIAAIDFANQELSANVNSHTPLQTYLKS